MRKKLQRNLWRPEIQEIQRILKLEARNWHHKFSYVSSSCTSHGEGLFDVKQIYGRSPTDDLDDLDVNNATWSVFVDVTLQAAVHLGRDHMENLRFNKNQLLLSAKQAFQVTGRLIEDQTEISGLTTIDCEQTTW